MKESLAKQCIAQPEKGKNKIKEETKFEIDDLFEKAASDYCEEIKRNHQGFRTKYNRQSSGIRSTSFKPSQENYLKRQKSSQGSSKQKLYQRTQNVRQMSRESISSSNTVVLVKDNSCSLVNIPSNLGSELMSSSESSFWVTSPNRPRLQIDLTKEDPSQQSSSRTQRHALCITLVMVVTVVAAMCLIIFIVTYLA